MERRFGRYLATMTLGSGAMGDVFRARDERLGREVALKTVRNVFGVHAELFRSRFEAEARALAALSHPAIVQIHDLGIEGEEPYLVMELVDGPSLKGRLERGAMSAAEVQAMGIQVARGLEAAHRRRILHRDLKPANILRSSTGQWKLADFGVAHLPESELTITGQFLGSPAYAAPESLTHGTFSEHSDVFGLAMTMVEAATGEKLRGNATMSELVQRSGEELVLPPALDAGLAAILRQALARDPARRPGAGRLAEMLAGADTSAGAVAVAPAAAPPAPAPGTATVALPATAPAPATATVALPATATVPVPETAVVPVAVASPVRHGLPWPAAIAAAVGVVAVVGLVASRGGTSSSSSSSPSSAKAVAIDAGPDAAPPPDATPPVDAAPLRKLPTIVPGRITVVYPLRMDPERYEAYAEVVGEVRANRFARALQYLDHYEQVYEATPESRHLRAQLEALPER